jgi:hypothetical protein
MAFYSNFPFAPEKLSPAQEAELNALLDDVLDLRGG